MNVNDRILEIMCEFIAEGYNYYSSCGEYFCMELNERMYKKGVPITRCYNGHCGDCDNCNLYSTFSMMKWLEGLQRKED